MTSRTAQDSYHYFRPFLLGITYFLLASISIYLSRNVTTVAHFWYANAIGVVFLLHSKGQGKRHLLCALAIANFAANWLTGSSWWLATAFIIPNLIEILIAVWMMQRFALHLDFDQSPKNMLRFVLQVCMLPCALAAFIGASILGSLTSELFVQILPMWFVSSSVGMLSLLPLLLVLQRDQNDQGTTTKDILNRNAASSLKKIIFFTILLFVVSFIALGFLPQPYIYLVIPLIMSAVETNTKTVTALIFLQSLIIGLMMHFGIFKAAFDGNEGLLFLNYLPIMATFFPPLILSATMNLFHSQNQKRSEVEEALRLNHIQLQTIVDHVPVLIGLWDKNLKNAFANRLYTSYFGWTPAQMLGKHVREVVGENTYQRNLPYMEAAMRGETQMFERAIVDPQGNDREILTYYVPSYRDGNIEGVFVFISDITDVKKAQRAEFVAEARVQSVIDSATEFSIIATDLQGTVRLFSKGAEKMLGYSSAEFVNLQSPAILHLKEEVVERGKELSIELQRPVAGFEVFIAKTGVGITETREWTYIHKSGRQIPVRLVVTAIVDAEKNITGYLGIANDISAEKQLQQLLITAKENAEKVSQAKSDFVANMSHEIRTPMNAVLGMAQLLAATNLSSEQRKYLDMIKISGQSLLGILNDILDFSKVEANRLELSETEFFLDDVLGAVASLMAVSVGEKDIEVAIGVCAGMATRLRGDRLRLQQILTNLTGNAVKFTQKGEVSVFVDMLPQTEGATDTIRQFRFCVRDSGIGMDAQQLDKLFQPFSQADASITRQFGGTGLGLSISKSILNLMGGDISVRSALGKGSEFTIVVPFETYPESQTDINAKGDRDQAKKMVRSLLVVDDNHTSNHYICQTIQAWNWEAVSARSGEEALQIVRERQSQHLTFDAILVDWKMPGMDGLAAIHQLRNLLGNEACPCIIMVSAFHRDAMLREAGSEFKEAILMKPMTGSSVFDTVHEAIAMRQRSPQISSHTRPQDQSVVAKNRAIAGMRLLLVEDNPFNQIVARGFLEQGGAKVDVLDNGALAVEHLRQHSADYHAVLMDVQMPILDGISATRIIRQELRLSLPIIAMTAGVMYAERDRCLQAGMDDFIAKPVDADQLLAALRQYLPVALRPSVAVESSVEISADNPDMPLSSDLFNPLPFERLLKAAPANSAQILQSMRALLDKAEDQFAAIKDSIQQSKMQEAASGLHTMRGSLGTLGAKSFAAMTLRIENDIKLGHFADLQVSMQQAEAALLATLVLAKDWLTLQLRQVTSVPATVLQSNLDSNSTAVDSARVGLAELEQLQQLLVSHDMAAYDIYQDLLPSLKQVLSAQNLSAQNLAVQDLVELDLSMQNLDFEKAHTLLLAIRTSNRW